MKMRHTVTVMNALGLVTGLVLMAPVPGHAQVPEPGASDVIVLFRDGVTPAERERLLRQSGGAGNRHFRNVPASAARADTRSRAFLERHPDVVAVVPDREVEKLGKPTSSGSATAPQGTPAVSIVQERRSVADRRGHLHPKRRRQ